MSRFGLVLGGGGPVGVAWYAGLAVGLSTCGVRLRDADIIIGTSAGAHAGAWLASDRSLGEFINALTRHAADNAGVDYAAGVDLDRLLRIYEVLGAASAPLEPEQCRAITAVGTQVHAEPGREDWFVDAFVPYVPDGGWSQRFRAVVVKVGRGEVRLLGPADGIDLARGVAASCAAPGIVAPIALDDGGYLDGGARSATNADLIERFDAARVVVASPIVPETPIVGPGITRVLDEEVRRLRARGVTVSVVQASDIEAEAFGFDLLNLANVTVAIEAGKERGRREGDRLLSG